MDQPDSREAEKGILPGHRVRLSRGLTRVGVPGHESAAEPQIILVREGDTVKAIEVVCTCGQRIRLNCLF
jgi:hypothetical protein